MNLKDNAIWLIFDAWAKQPPPYHGKYVDSVNDYFCHKIDEYMKEVKHKFVVLNTEEKIKNGLHKVFKDYLIVEHKDIPNIVKGFTSIVYTGFHHGRCTIERKLSGAKDMYHNTLTNIYFKKDLLCLLPGDSWLEMDKKSEQYGELI